MLTWLRSRSLSGRTATGLYGSIVTQSRLSSFYTEGGVPDTVEGRFALIGVHMFLVLERLRGEGAAAQELGRALLETLMTDLDDNLREIGIGDTGVPPRVKKAAAALQEQIVAYRGAMASDDDEPLANCLREYVYLEGPSPAAGRLARYVRQCSRELATQTWGEIKAARISFPSFQ